MNCINNDNKQYILSFPAKYMTYLFNKNDINIHSNITVLYKSKNNYIFNQLQNNPCAKYVYNEQSLPSVLYTCTTDYILIINGYDAVITDDLDYDFIKKFNDVTTNLEHKFIFAGSDKCLNFLSNYEFEVSDGVSKYPNFTLIFGLKKDVIPFIQRLYNWQFTKMSTKLHNVSDRSVLYDLALINFDCSKNIDKNCELFSTLHENTHYLVEEDDKLYIKKRKIHLSNNLLYLKTMEE